MWTEWTKELNRWRTGLTSELKNNMVWKVKPAMKSLRLLSSDKFIMNISIFIYHLRCHNIYTLQCFFLISDFAISWLKPVILWYCISVICIAQYEPLFILWKELLTGNMQRMQWRNYESGRDVMQRFLWVCESLSTKQKTWISSIIKWCLWVGHWPQ